MNVGLLKERYRVGPNKPIDCSVGGSICLEMAPDDTPEETLNLLRFPNPGLLVDFLAAANTAIGESLIWDLAKDIYEFYEAGKISEAWESLEKALSSDV